MKKSLKVNVYAKLNLSLNVFPKEGDYHPVDGVAVSVNIRDVVSVKMRKDKKIILRGCADIPIEQNSAYRAAVAFARRYGVGCDIKIKKGIPRGVGLGGSSADAAAVVACLCKLCDLDKNNRDIAEMCAELGSDINFMRFGGMARLSGKGDDMSFFENYPRLFFAITFFGAEFSTREVYRRFDQLGQSGEVCDNDKIAELFRAEDAKSAITLLDNGLQNAALSVAEEKTKEKIESYFAACADLGYAPHMTGSGSAFFIAFATREEAKLAAKMLKSQKFDTRCADFSAWGVETREMIFHVI